MLTAIVLIGGAGFYAGFRCGARFQTFRAMGIRAKQRIDEWLKEA